VSYLLKLVQRLGAAENSGCQLLTVYIAVKAQYVRPERSHQRAPRGSATPHYGMCQLISIQPKRAMFFEHTPDSALAGSEIAGETNQIEFVHSLF
jgi:hypothetical protein